MSRNAQRLSAEDHARVSAAIATAEQQSDGEIIAAVSPLSDAYHDVALHWAVLAIIAVLAWAAAWPSALEWWFARLSGGWSSEPSLRELLTFLMILAVLKFTVVLLILRWMPLRLALTPGGTKQRRVRRRAVALFKRYGAKKTANIIWRFVNGKHVGSKEREAVKAFIGISAISSACSK